MKIWRWKHLLRLGFPAPLNKKLKNRRERTFNSYYGNCHVNLQKLKAHYRGLRTIYLKKLYKFLSKKYSSDLQEHLVRILESRLDSVVYKSTLCKSIDQASQIILHGQVKVNGKRVNVRSYGVRVGDEITFDDKIEHLLDTTNVQQMPPYLTFDMDRKVVKLSKEIGIEDVNYKTNIDFNMVLNALKR